MTFDGNEDSAALALWHGRVAVYLDGQDGVGASIEHLFVEPA